jgi:murein DD-endopeptidase MepM/ murein hydrolase activator NlpD
MNEDLQEFLRLYDPGGNLNFEQLRYRNGAAITCRFGIAEGYKVVGGALEWGWVRIHTGVDRFKGRKGDLVVAPFDFNRSAFRDYNGRGYGSLVRLFSDEWGFEMRIAHMNPDGDIDPTVLQKLERGERVRRNTVLGRAGLYGVGTGRHTHTEVISLGPWNVIFDAILRMRWGEVARRDYIAEEIVTEYARYPKFAGASSIEILEDWTQQKRDRRVLAINRFAYRYWDGLLEQQATRYSSELLFNGL